MFHAEMQGLSLLVNGWHTYGQALSMLLSRMTDVLQRMVKLTGYLAHMLYTCRVLHHERDGALQGR